MKEEKNPTNWDIYQCIFNISNRLFVQEKITKWILVISLINLLLNLIQMLLML